MKELYNLDIMKDFYKNAKPAIPFINATRSLRQEERENLIDEYKLKRDRIWSELGNQVIGPEVFC